MNLPKVSVIIPTYNRWPQICTAIDSVLNQTYTNVECIVVDDNSQDNTSHYIQKKYNEKVCLLNHKKNMEKSKSRNDGIRHSNADYVCILDSDDRLTPDSIEKRVKIFIENPDFNGVVFGYVERGKHIPLKKFLSSEFNGDVLIRFIKQQFIHHNGILVSRANMLAIGMYNERLTNWEDHDLLIKLMANLPFKYCHALVAINQTMAESASTNHSKIIKQGVKFSTVLKQNSEIVAKIGYSKLKHIEFKENWFLIDSYFQTKNYKQLLNYFYLSLKKWPFRTISEKGLIKRFFLALLKSNLGKMRTL